ncbi:hypothetical protein BCV70DRAFT_87933 [Testicularia cyperi]|uniref:Uncharacterized protein n=1 Tax=Testicularia cyperi TaxID=1882483 RepID=A0A317XRM8_9BASI|nr:hypothetical protein BCV70DRAFT_87933 [Testicularia cyperi]
MVKITAAAAGAVVLAAAVSAQPIINTPASITQCAPAALAWSGATGTVRLNILPGGESSAAPLQSLPNQSGASGSYVWTVNVASGTSITIAILDDSGTPNYSSQLTVLSSSDTSCLGQAATGSTAAGSATSTATSAASSSASSAASSSSSRASSATSAASSSASSASSSRSSSAASATATRSTNAAAGSFSPATAGLSVLAIAGALLPFF